LLFCSYEFGIFFLLTLALYAGFRRFGSWRQAKVVLLAASLVSYSYWFYPYLLILLASVLINYRAGAAVGSAADGRARRWALILGLAGNLGLLGFFKYSDFLLANAGRLLAVLGLGEGLPRAGILLPIGISFFTFQGMSYVIDVYRGRLKPVRSLLDFSVFITSFIQLVAGPIVRATEFLPQLARRTRFGWVPFYWGSYLIILGVFKKLVIADNLAIAVDFFFGFPDYTNVPATISWVYMLCYAAQIYADFSGYTDLARGMAHILGFRLPFNFYYPYTALGFGDFWRRWHISLSRWFRDYLYIPLGGSRGARTLLARNMLLTMFLVGLWHGASWMFVWWGVLHGLYLLLDHFLFRPYLLPRVTGPGPGPWLGRTLVRLLTLAAVVLAWVFFRSQSLDQALGITRSMLPFLFDYPPLPPNPLAAVWLMIKVRAAALMTPLDLPWDFWRIIQPAAIILAMHLAALWTWGGRMHRRYPKPVYFVTALAMLLMIFFNRAGTDNAFIYFQF